MRRVIVTLLFILALTLSVSAQSSEPAAQVRWGATDPPKCTGGRGFVFYNSTSHLLKKCDTTDTWTTIGSGGGSGDVVGPGSATDNAIVRFDGTTGKLMQNSAATIADTSGDITAGKYNGITFTPVTATFTLIGSTVITGPGTTTTLPGLSLANTFTAKQTITPAANTNALAVSGYSLTGSNTQPLFDLNGNWDVGSATPTAIKLNITNTASGSNSKLLDLLVNSSSVFSVGKDGLVSAPDFQGSSGLFVVNTDGSIGMSVDATSAKISVANALFEIAQSGGGVIGNGSFKINGANFSIGEVPSDAFIDFDIDTSLFRIGVGGRTIKIGDTDGQGNGVLLKVDDLNGFLSLTGATTVFSTDNTATPTASALVSINSTDLGFLPPRMTTTQRDNVSSPAEGLTVFNTTTHVPNYWNGSAWSAGNGAPYTDAVAIIKGSGDTSKLLKIEIDGFTTGTTRVLTPPNADTIIPIITQQLTFAGPTAARTITFPDASITVARTDAANTFTGVQIMTTPSFITGFTIGGAATSRKAMVGNGTNFVPSTETWAVPGTSGNVLTSDGTNWTSATPAGGGTTINATDGVVPYRSSSTTFANSPITVSIPGSMVDGLTITGAATANPATATIAATGSDTNIRLALTTKGAGNIIVNNGGILAPDFGAESGTLSYGFATEPTTGMWHQSNTILLRIAGTDRLSVVSSGITVTGSGTFSGSLIVNGSTSVIRLKGYTVATLPSGTQGDTAFVTDALAPTFLATIVGGGTVVTPVFFNGTAWVGY